MLAILDFSHLSQRNDQFLKRQVAVLNGTVFTVLDIPLKQALKQSNILYLHVHRESRRCYIGITIMTAQMRWGTGNPYRNNPRFGNSIKKYGWESFDSYIVAIAENRDDLSKAEVTAIAAAGGHKTKLTYNMSPGGDIVSETNKPIVGVNLKTGETIKFKGGSGAARKLGFKNPDMPMAVAGGKNLSVKDWWFRFEDDEESRPPELWGEKRRIAEVQKRQGKRIVGINYETLEKKVFATTAEAGATLEMHQSLISMVARGEIKSAKGWWFKFEGSQAEMPTIFGSDLTRTKRDKKVYAVNLTTNERKEFRNCTVADKALGIYRGASASVCSGERVSAADWWFSYDKDGVPPAEFKGALVAKARSKAVIAKRVGSTEEQQFNSAKEASEELGMSRSLISMVLNGKRASASGYIFRFVTDEYDNQ